jgi:hypothetical protein
MRPHLERLRLIEDSLDVRARRENGHRPAGGLS